jgi:hypothetical protein
MPMVVRPPEPHRSEVSRTGGASTIGHPPPLEDLLPSGGSLVPAPAPAPHRVLALDALRLRRVLRAGDHRPLPWTEPRFAREVELVRRHLAPLRSRRSLTASFGREAFHGLDGRPTTPPIGPIRAAYAIRWFELGGRMTLPAWTNLLDEPSAWG